jgi:hypothetical protein
LGTFRGNGFKSGKRRLWGTIVWFSYNTINPRGIWLTHAGPGGRILLKTEVHWTNINGILIRTKNTQTFLSFRRRPR